MFRFKKESLILTDGDSSHKKNYTCVQSTKMIYSFTSTGFENVV